MRFQDFSYFLRAGALQRAFEGDAGEDEHYEHEDEQEHYVAAYCGEVGAFEEDLFDCAYRMGFRIEVREGAQPRRETLDRVDRAAREKIQRPRA